MVSVKSGTDRAKFHLTVFEKIIPTIQLRRASLLHGLENLFLGKRMPINS